MHVLERLDDGVGDRVAIGVRGERVDPDLGVCEVEEVDAPPAVHVLGDDRQGLQGQVGLAVEHDHGAVRVGDVRGDAAAHDRRLAGPLAADQHRVHPLVGVGDSHEAVLIAHERQFLRHPPDLGWRRHTWDRRALDANPLHEWRREVPETGELGGREDAPAPRGDRVAERPADPARVQLPANPDVALDEPVLGARAAADGPRDAPCLRVGRGRHAEVGEEERPVLQLKAALELLLRDFGADAGVAALGTDTRLLELALLAAEEPARYAIERRGRGRERVLDGARLARSRHRRDETVDERLLVALRRLQPRRERPALLQPQDVTQPGELAGPLNQSRVAVAGDEPAIERLGEAGLVGQGEDKPHAASGLVGYGVQLQRKRRLA